MSSNKPTLILVHGAWHSSACWAQLIAYLKPHDYKCETVELPSVGTSETRASVTLEDDVVAIRSSILTVLARGENAILVCHSYAGLPAQAATADIPVPDQGEKTRKGTLLAIAMINALLLPPRITPIDWAGAPPPFLDVNESTGVVLIGPPGPRELLYNDLPLPVAEHWISTLRPFSWSTHTTLSTAESAGFLRGIPTHYLMCSLDQAVPGFVQLKMIEGAEALMTEKGLEGRIRVEKLTMGHSPFLGDDARVAQCGEFVMRCAGEIIPA